VKYFIFFYVFFILGCSLQPIQEEKPLKRVALIIGNQDYKNNSLQNPVNDAKAIASTLRGIGFDVNLILNSTSKKLNQALSEIKPKIDPDNTILLIYFAGHGNTLKKDSKEQYLMMTDKDKMVLVSIYKFYTFLNDAKARHNIMMIDACRDYKEHYIPIKKGKNNFRGNFREVTLRSTDGVKKKKFVTLDNNYTYAFPKSTIVSFSTDLYQKAKDWSYYDAKHSPYSYALMNYLDDEEIPIEEVFRRVRTSVQKETHDEQRNSEETNLEKNIWLVPKRASVAFFPPI